MALALLTCPLAAQAKGVAPVLYDFEGANPKVPFTPYSTPGGVTAAVKISTENGAAVFKNQAGGSFGVTFGVTPIDTEMYPVMVFDYQVDKDTKVDFFLRVNAKYHGIGFTGPAQMRPGSILLGKVPGVIADGQWHRGVLPIRDWLRSLYPFATNLTVDEFIAGNWNNEGYLMAGVGGNGPGATWKIKNLALLTPKAQSADFTVPEAVGYSLDGEKAKATGNFENLSEGFHVVGLVDKAGKVFQKVPYLASSAPHTGTPSWQDTDLVWPVSVGSGLDFKTLKLTVDGKSYGLDSPLLKFDGPKSELRFRASNAGQTWPDRSTVALGIEGLTDSTGRGKGTGVANLTVDYSKHDGPAPRPTVSVDGLTFPGVGTFETGVDEWATMDVGQFPGGIVDRVARGGSDPANQWALRLTCPRTATPFGVKIRSTPFDASKFPILLFDYKITDRLRADFRVTWNGSSYSIRFADRDTPVPKLGTIDGVQTDGQWHTAEIPLLEWMKKTQPSATNFTITDFSVMDDGWMGNAKGVQWYVDNFQFVPQITGGSLKATVQLSDYTGLKGISWLLNADPTTVPDEKAESVDSLQTPGDGRTYLHLRAQNGAGHWSPSLHIPVLIVPPPPPPVPAE